MMRNIFLSIQMDEYIKDSGVFKMKYENFIKHVIQEKNNILKSKQRIFHVKVKKF